MWVQVDVHVFGSVALKAYLPDGDIDFALLGRDAAEPEGRRPLREMWTQCLADVFNRERQSPQTQLRIGEVQVINAEVRPPVSGSLCHGIHGSLVNGQVCMYQSVRRGPSFATLAATLCIEARRSTFGCR